MLVLEVKARDDKQSTEELRASGLIPAVFYGPKETAQAVALDARKIESVWREAGETTIVTLKGVGADKDTLIRDIQVHPVSGAILHVDFYVLEKGKKVEIAVPLEFDGEAPAEKLGHIIVKTLHEIEIEVAPAELPHELHVDISGLENVGDQVLASDIKLPPSATLVTAADEIIVSVTAFEEYKEQEVPTEAAPASEVSTDATAEATKDEKSE